MQRSASTNCATAYPNLLKYAGIKTVKGVGFVLYLIFKQYYGFHSAALASFLTLIFSIFAIKKHVKVYRFSSTVCVMQMCNKMACVFDKIPII